MTTDEASAADEGADAREPLVPASPPAPASPRSPSPVVAALLSLVAIGLGHVYGGRLLRGALWIAAALFVWLPLAWIMVRSWPGGFVALYGLAVIGVWLAAALDAALAAKGGARASWVRVVVAAIVLLGLLRGALWALRRHVVEAFGTPSGSMAPTLLVGDRFLVDKTRGGELPARGDVIIFRFPERRADIFVQRVVALPGDRVEVRGGRLWLNGVAVPRCRLGVARWKGAPDGDETAVTLEGDLFVEWLDARPHLAFYAVTGLVGGNPSPIYAPSERGPWIVGAGEVWVLGDNRNGSNDSRSWFAAKGGGVALPDVLGRAFRVWLSSASDGVRPERARIDLAAKPTLPIDMQTLQPALDRCLAPDPPLDPVK